MVVLYSNGCPRCVILKKKLDEKKIEYKISDNLNDIVKEGFMSVPVLKVDDFTFLGFGEATKWINGM